MSSTGFSRCLLLKKQIESDLGCKMSSGRPDFLDLSEPEHKLSSPSEKPYGDLPIDSGFIANRKFIQNFKEGSGEKIWLRGRVQKKADHVVILVNDCCSLLTSENQDLLSYLDQLTEDSVVDTCGTLSGGEQNWSFCMTQLYGVSESSGEDRSNQASRVAAFRARSDAISLFRNFLVDHEFIEVGTLGEVNTALHLDISRIFCLIEGRCLEALMEVEDNYMEIVSFVSFMLDAFSHLRGGSNPTPILTFRECLNILGAGAGDLFKSESDKFDPAALTEKIKSEFGTDCFVIDKLPRMGDAMPDPFNAEVCNRFEGYCNGKVVITGQQNVHDATLIHQRCAIHMHNGTMPHGKFSIDIRTLATILQS